MNMRKLLLILLAVLLLPGALLSQDISIKVDYPGVVAVGEQLRIVWTVNTSGGDFSAPPFDGFYKMSGPNVSYSQSTQIIGGRRTSETSYSYVFYLQALREGKYTLPGATYTKGGKTYTSEVAVIEVVKDESGKQAASGVSEGTSGQPSDGAEIFVRLIINKKEVFLGEPVAATVKLFTRIDISGINEVKYPIFNGFLKEEIPTPQLTSLERENVNGAIYGTGVFQKFLLYPQKTGEIIIDPVQITVLMRQRSGTGDPFFGDFFQTFSTVPRVVTGEAMTINVKPLPGNRPSDFMGAVGNFDLKAEINRDTVQVNDAVNLKLILTGRGNLKLADAPIVAIPAGLEAYDPKMTLNAVNSEAGTSGSKTFEYLIIPRNAGDFKIPAITYSFFDPSSGQYNRVTSKPFNLHVLKSGDAGAGQQIFGGVPGEEIRYIGKDIRFIKTTPPQLRKSANWLLTRRSFFSLYGFALLGFIIIVVARREQVRRNSDRVRVKNRKAGRIASQRLRIARKYLKINDKEKFYEEVLKAIWGYTGDKLNIPVSELTRSRGVDELRKRGVDEALISSLTELADICEMVRYAPSSSSADTAHVYSEASRIIRELDEKLN
jgi:hypothetical protein